MSPTFLNVTHILLGVFPWLAGPVPEPVLHSSALLPAGMGQGVLESHSCICCCTTAANPARALAEKNMITSLGAAGVTAQSEETL